MTKITKSTTGIHCFECSEDYPDVEECDSHGDENIKSINIVPCSEGVNCPSEDHHYGLEAHVTDADD